ncbi:MAG: FadR family transcriptional regulator [Anaerolineae bacterium]|nr:FadR family transcriptional regulator [Anaerolineae bacterium]
MLSDHNLGGKLVRPVFEEVQSERLSDQVCRQLLEAIVDGHYGSGERLPPERELTSMFHASRIVVREALSLLSARGIVSIKQGLGTTVNPVSSWRSLDPEVLILLYGESGALTQLQEVRRLIEPDVAALAAERITSAQLEELRAISVLRADDTVEQHVERDTEFHLQIARAARNQVLLIVMSSLGELLRESRRCLFGVAGALAEAREWHKRIFEVIEARDPDAARKAMVGHLEQVQEGVRSLPHT